MKTKFYIVATAISCVVAAVALYFFRFDRLEGSQSSRPAIATTKPSTNLQNTNQYKTDSVGPGAKEVFKANSQTADAFKRVRSSLDLYAEYKSLFNSGDAASLGLRGLLVEYCTEARSVERNRKNYPPAIVPAGISGTAYYDLRKQFRDRLVNSTPQKVCKGFPDAELVIDDARRNILAAANAGDHQSIARRIGLSVIDQSAPLANVSSPYFKVDPELLAENTNYGRALSAQDFESLKSALSTKEPTAILMAGPVLTAAFRETSVHFGPDGRHVDSIVANYLWEGVACVFSASCAAENFEQFQRGCVLANRCDAVDYDDYLERYILSASELAEYRFFRQLLVRAISTNDWSGVSLVAANNPFPIGGAVPRRPLPPRIR
jgi:hypothetical protein